MATKDWKLKTNRQTLKTFYVLYVNKKRKTRYTEVSIRLINNSIDRNNKKYNVIAWDTKPKFGAWKHVKRGKFFSTKTGAIKVARDFMRTH